MFLPISFHFCTVHLPLQLRTISGFQEKLGIISNEPSTSGSRTSSQTSGQEKNDCDDSHEIHNIRKIVFPSFLLHVCISFKVIKSH